MSVCPGGCNREWRKLAPAKRVQLGLAATAGQPVWCGPCAAGVVAALRHIVDAYTQLELDKLRGPTAAPHDQHVSGSRDAPSPSPAADEQDELVRRLVWWEDQIREARGLARRGARLPVTPSRQLDRCPWPRPLLPRRPPRSVGLLRPSVESTTLTGTVRFLQANLGWALAQVGIPLDPGPGELIGRDLLRLRALIGGRTKTRPQRSRRDVPCPRCEMRTLVHEGGTDHVQCENPDCRRMLSLDEYDELAGAVARSESA